LDTIEDTGLRPMGSPVDAKNILLRLVGQAKSFAGFICLKLEDTPLPRPFFVDPITIEANHRIAKTHGKPNASRTPVCEVAE
jgi:hypothetical protein